jgi:hypothetical protein
MLQALANGERTDAGGRNNMRLMDRAGSSVTGSPSYSNAHLGVLPLAADTVRNATDQINSEHGTSYSPMQIQAVVWTRQIERYNMGQIRSILSPGNIS